MKKCSSHLALVFSILFTGIAYSQALPNRTAIDEYVQADDPSYGWEIVSQESKAGLTNVVVEMVSQNWLTPEEVDRTEWRHWVNIAIPDKVVSQTAMLMISGGANGGQPPSELPFEIAQISRATGTVVAELKMVPNQPLTFHGDGKGRKEDDLIGYTWDQFLKTGEPRWLARNAMVKSAVKAMDTITAVAAESRNVEVNKFVVAGASKRGWTTWLTGAMDSRVAAIIPIVIDVLNVDASMRHHFAAYGYWAPAVGNYVEHGIMEQFGHPRIAELYRLVDPYHYRHRLTMPKLILNAAGDQFFLPDSSNFYWKDLSGEKHLRYVPNTDHGMKGSDALETLIAFYTLIASGKERPEFSWNLSPEGTFTVEPHDKPKAVKLWTATNPIARDFRLETLGPKYTSQDLQPDENGIYTTSTKEPVKGWTASFVELTFDVGGPLPLKLTTGVHVTPTELPYASRDPSLASSLTLRCITKNSDAAAKLIAQAKPLFAAKLDVNDLETKQVGEIVYLNWGSKDLRDQVGVVGQWLESEGASQITLQLESGRTITATN